MTDDHLMMNDDAIPHATRQPPVNHYHKGQCKRPVWNSFLSATMCDSQLNLAISYYNLYTNLSTDEVAPPSSIADEASINSTVDDVANEKVLIIQDDVWTAQDEEEAAALLERSLDRCRINLPATALDNVQAPSSSSSSSPGRGGLIPDDTIAWDQFYRQHQTNFFKDRHYLQKTFPHEFGTSNDILLSPQPPPPRRTLVEIGCGVGNALLPLLEDDSQSRSWTVHGIDLSSVAIDLMRRDSRFQEAAQDGRAFGWTANLVQGLPVDCHGVATVSTLLFCLSAIDPTQHVVAARHAAATLQEGGVLIIRDYGRYDEAQLKLAAQRHKLLSNNFYVKFDSTKCYYFTTDDLHRLFVQECGLVALDNECIRKVYTNRHTGVARRRAWVQARFRKPASTELP
jgi:SAM-dependent methyltransferase